MKDRLFIQLPDDARDELHWGVWNSDEKQWKERGSLLTVDLIALAEQSARCETIIVVPASKVARKKVHTPAKQLKQIQRAVPYTLEDHLAHPIDQLHFAFGKRDKEGMVEVYWVTHEHMKQWLDWFEQAEIKVDQLVCELALIHPIEDTTEIILKEQFAVVSEVDGNVWSCQRDLLPLLWDKRHAETKSAEEENSTADEVTRVFYFGELESYWNEKEAIISQVMTQEDYFESISQHLEKTTVSLLQQEYTPKKESNLQWRKYKSAIWAASFAFIIFIGFQGSRYFVLSQENQVLRNQGEQYFSRVFSRRPRAGDLLGQTERLLNKAGGASKEGEFLKLLNSTSAQILSLEKIKPTAITFDGRKRELRVDVIAPDYQSLNTFKDELIKSGLTVDMSSASAQGNAYSTRLIIRSGS